MSPKPWRVAFDRIAPILIAVLAVLAVTALVGTFFNQRADHRQDVQRTADNTANAIVNCQNGNQSRRAAWALWNYVLTATEASNPNQTPQQVAFVNEFRRYVGQVYQPHDCHDLARKYPLPPPPTIPASG